MKQKTGFRAPTAVLTMLLILAGSSYSRGQKPAVSTSVVMLSDLHFDPYRDPSKVNELRLANVRDWPTILNRPDAANQPEAFAALQKACKARGVDSSWTLIKSSLHAARTQQPSPLFVTVSGDLLTHNFDCRLRTLVSAVTAEEIAAFAEMTVEFVALQLRETFPGAPVYMALGNNDSGCADKRQTVGSKFMQSSSQVFVEGAFNERHHAAVRPLFDRIYDYSAVLPKSLKHGRLIVLQDVFAMPDYKDCDGKTDETIAAAQIVWLREQLTYARSHHEQVWVMAHVPPGVDEYASFHKYLASPEKLCDPFPLTMMLKSDDLVDALTEYSDVVRLAIFAHTHMDEMKALGDGKGHVVPARIVPSISPVNGSLPAFTVGKVDADSGILRDYAVYVAADVEATSWAKAYDFATTYKEPDYSAKSVADLTARLAADKNGSEESSMAYQRWFLAGNVGDYSAGVRALWPSYGCGTTETHEAAFRDCMCPAAGPMAK